jgi:hypothetical protein
MEWLNKNPVEIVVYLASPLGNITLPGSFSKELNPGTTQPVVYHSIKPIHSTGIGRHQPIVVKSQRITGIFITKKKTASFTCLANLTGILLVFPSPHSLSFGLCAFAEDCAVFHLQLFR